MSSAKNAHDRVKPKFDLRGIGATRAILRINIDKMYPFIPSVLVLVLAPASLAAIVCALCESVPNECDSDFGVILPVPIDLAKSMEVSEDFPGALDV
jgi:hypothetical protein